MLTVQPWVVLHRVLAVVSNDQEISEPNEGMVLSADDICIYHTKILALNVADKYLMYLKHYY